MMEKMLRRIRRFCSLRRNVDDDRSPLGRSTPDKDRPFHINNMQLRQFLEQHLGGRVDIEEEHVTPQQAGDPVPCTFQIQVTVRTNSKTLLTLNLFVKMLMDDQDDLPKIERAYMRLDELINMKKVVQTYNVVIPKIGMFQEQMKIQKHFLISNLFPECVGARMSLQPRLLYLPDQSSAIMLYNPCEQCTFDAWELEGCRYNGFRYNTSVLILRDMARFHAGTIAMRLKENTTFEREIIPIVSLEVKRFKKIPPFETLSHELISHGLRDVQLPDDQIVAIRESLHLYRLDDWIIRAGRDQTWYALSYSRYCNPYIMSSQTRSNATKTSKLLELHRSGFNNCCEDLASFIFTCVNPEIFELRFAIFQMFENLLEEYYYEFNRTLQVHKIPIDQYTYHGFTSEFHAVGKKMLAHIFESIKSCFCENYNRDGDPILSNEYSKRIKATVNIMTMYKWIKPSDSNFSDVSTDRNLLLLS
ncbi:hypothetical protein HUJ04_006810 [Dendroctonus ponderosae]|nr:hypothetical protein HUJ04_006810 [Dendroctonus ponderosae]